MHGSHNPISREYPSSSIPVELYLVSEALPVTKFKRLTAEATRLPRIRTSCPPLQAAILRLKPHGSGFAELHRHFMQLEGRLQALPSYHPATSRAGCMLMAAC